MITYTLLAAAAATLWGGAPPVRPAPQTIEQVCSSPGARLADARVRVAWTPLALDEPAVQVSYCILRGEKDAKLEFERDAEIVYFALAADDRNTPRKTYVFTIRTSEGRVLQQGPATLQPTARQLQSCRVEVCQFLTDPGERVVEVSAATLDSPLKR